MRPMTTCQPRKVGPCLTDKRPVSAQGTSQDGRSACAHDVWGTRGASRRARAELRRRHREEIAERLREARSYGDGSNNDEYHALREEQMVLEARIALLETDVARAVVIGSRPDRTTGSRASARRCRSKISPRAAVAAIGSRAPTPQDSGVHLRGVPARAGADGSQRGNGRHGRSAERALAERAPDCRGDPESRRSDGA